MRSALSGAAWIGLAFTAATPLPAQFQNNTEKQMTCQNGNYDNNRERHCEIREQTVPSVGRLNIDMGGNGSATVKGWAQRDVLVRARVEASADTQSAAASMAARVLIDSSGAQVRAIGPDSADNSWWTVSYEIFVPQASDVDLKGNNGGLTVSDIRGQIHFDLVNGGVHLKRVAGDVTGNTVNGGIQVELAGASFDGHQMQVKTQNGGVTVSMPSSYSAHIQAETGMGSIQSDFPGALERNIRTRRLDFSVGAGGPLIHITTGNGGIQLKKAEL